ncbi:MAG: methyltransferase domain-containing protein [Gammaproteobacteria bacterium]
MTGERAPDPTHWDRYWHADRLSACLADEDTHTSGAAIRAGWVAFFEALPATARILDIGTGNGAIAIIASETGRARQKQFEIHGVDQADIDPARFLQDAGAMLTAIHFHARTPSEVLPFPAAHFDAITGQYALEYTDLAATLAEFRRVAKPGAQLRFVLHAEDAQPVIGAGRDLAEIAFLMDDLAILEKARALMRAAFAFETAASYDAELEAQARAAHEAYLAAAQQADARYAVAGCKPMFTDLLAGIRSAWDRRRELTLDYILGGIGAIETEMCAHQARLQEMRRAALSADALDDLVTLFGDNGFESVSTSELRVPDIVRYVGWNLQATRYGENAHE